MTGTLSGFGHILHLGFFHCPNRPVNRQSPQYDLTPLDETAVIHHHQRYLFFVIAWHVWYPYSGNYIAQGLSNPSPSRLNGMHPLWSFRSQIKPTSRPLLFTNSSVTRFMWAPLSIKQVVSTPSIIAVPKFAWLNQRFLGFSFQNTEGVNCGVTSFWHWLYQPWPSPSGGSGSLHPGSPIPV